MLESSGETMTEKLKSCPFCGRQMKYDFNLWFDTELKSRIFCPTCSIGTSWLETQKEAIKKWNRRVKP
jgi:Lar family restriction alleviation protein